MTPARDRAAQEEALCRIEVGHAQQPDSIALLRARAEALQALGHDDAAKAAYLTLLARDSTHLGALIGMGRLAYDLGHRSVACTAFGQAVHHHPDASAPRASLAFAQAGLGQPVAAQAEYETALHREPGRVEAHHGVANLLAEQGDTAAAMRHWRAAFKERPIRRRACRGAAAPIVVLVLVTITGANIPMLRWLDERVFEIVEVVVEFCESGQKLLPHDLVENGATAERAGSIRAYAPPIVTVLWAVSTIPTFTGMPEFAMSVATRSRMPWVPT